MATFKLYSLKNVISRSLKKILGHVIEYQKLAQNFEPPTRCVGVKIEEMGLFLMLNEVIIKFFEIRKIYIFGEKKFETRHKFFNFSPNSKKSHFWEKKFEIHLKFFNFSQNS